MFMDFSSKKGWSHDKIMFSFFCMFDCWEKTWKFIFIRVSLLWIIKNISCCLFKSLFNWSHQFFHILPQDCSLQFIWAFACVKGRLYAQIFFEFCNFTRMPSCILFENILLPRRLGSSLRDERQRVQLPNRRLHHQWHVWHKQMPAAGATHRSPDYGTSTNRLELRMLCAKGSRNRLKTNSFVKISFGEKASFHLSLKN